MSAAEKTVVALYGMLVAIANKMQAVLLAPTEVLAEQHYLTLSTLLKDSSVRVELFTGRTKRTNRAVHLLADGSIHLAVGTQALIQEDVDFANLGLVVIDEQHKLRRAPARGAQGQRIFASLSRDDGHADSANARALLFRRF